jgi:hypothetical protein
MNKNKIKIHDYPFFSLEFSICLKLKLAKIRKLSLKNSPLVSMQRLFDSTLIESSKLLGVCTLQI